MDNRRKNNQKSMIVLVDSYCKIMGVRKDVLTTKKRTSKVVKGVHVDYMRMCLAHYMINNGVLLGHAASMIGYATHSTISHNRKIINHYIETKDPYLYPYWEKLMELVKVLKPV